MDWVRCRYDRFCRRHDFGNKRLFHSLVGPPAGLHRHAGRGPGRDPGNGIPFRRFFPLLRWSLAIIAGGGAAGLVQASTVALRGLSLTTTGGLANPFFSLLETLGAAGLSLFAILIPIVTLALVVVLILFVLSRALHKKTRIE